MPPRRLKPGTHRTCQRCSGPVCDRPSAPRPVPSRQNRLQARLDAVLTGRNGPGRARTFVNRAGTVVTGAVRTGRQSPSWQRRISRRRVMIDNVCSLRATFGRHPVPSRSGEASRLREKRTRCGVTVSKTRRGHWIAGIQMDDIAWAQRCLFSSPRSCQFQ